MSDKRTFTTFNGMSRPAQYWGVPIFPFAGVALASLIVGGVGIFLFSWWGLGGLLPGGSALLAMRFMCNHDGKALSRLGYVRRRWKLNASTGKSLFLSPYNPKWSAFYGKRYAAKHAIRRPPR